MKIQFIFSIQFNSFKVQFISAEVMKILRKSQPQIREKLRKLSLKKKFLYKNRRVAGKSVVDCLTFS